MMVESKSRTWLTLMLGIFLGVALGGLAFLILFGIRSTPAPLHRLPQPHESIDGTPDPVEPRLGGNAVTVLKDFEIHDLQGNRVLHVSKASTMLDLAALHRGILRMPSGRVTGAELLIRRGNSGRVSLAEVFGRAASDTKQNGKAKAPEKQLKLGPFQVRNVRLKVALIARPLVFHVDRAVVRVERTTDDTAPKIYLSHLHGYMVEPDPLPQPVRIVGGEGVVDLARDPLLDLRTRVCIGGGELRMRIELAKQQRPVGLRADADGFTARAALMGLGMVARFKDDKLNLSRGPVELSEAGDCSRAEGRDKKAEVEQEDEAEPEAGH